MADNPQRTSDKHGPRVDDGLNDEVSHRTPTHDAEGVVRHPDTPEGTLTPDQVDARTELAASLQRHVFPATRDELLASAEEMQAAPEVIATLRQLPEGEYENVQAIWTALGGPTEERN